MHAGKFGLYCRVMTLKIGMDVVLGENIIMKKFHANPMHVLNVVHARMCTQAILGYFFRIFRVDIVRMDARKSNTTRTKHYGNLEGLQEGSLSEACFCRDLQHTEVLIQ